MGDVDKFPRKTHIHGKHYRCTFSRRVKVSEADGKPVYSSGPPSATLAIDFWNSYADAEFNAIGSKAHQLGETWHMYGKDKKRRTPKAYDLLACVQKNDIGTFEDFCGDFGYDTDSRRAFETYTAVQDEFRRVSRFFSASELEKLQEVQ